MSFDNPRTPRAAAQSTMLQRVAAAYFLAMHRSMNQHLMTLAEYEALPENDYYVDEVSRGRLVREPRPASVHGLIVARLAHEFCAYLDAHPGIGRVWAESGFVLADEPLTLRGPDVAFVRADRSPPESGFFRGAPDIAIEVVSPSNSASDLQLKVLEFLEAGTILVWVIYPETCTVIEHHSSSEIRILRSSDVLTSPVLPGFALPLSAIFG
jgi:Uma2 family endonuclease